MRRLLLLSAVLVLSIAWLMPSAQAANRALNVDVSNVTNNSRLGAGETMSYSFQLLNFGGNKRADAVVTHTIYDDGSKVVYRQTETVAVETTASFVRHVQLPTSLKPGAYVLRTSITYEGQEAPAESQFSFVVVNKIKGVEQRTFLIIAAITVGIFILLLVMSILLFGKWSKARELSTFDYSHIPENERPFYEIISDGISQMRLSAGDTALEIAADVPNLTVNRKTGQVIAITGNPSAVITTLVLRYETLLGRRLAPEKHPAHKPHQDRQKEIS